MSFKRKPPPGNVRRTVSLGNNFRGVTTNKQGRIIQFESEQERKLVLLLERDPTVVNYNSQPETLHSAIVVDTTEATSQISKCGMPVGKSNCMR